MENSNEFIKTREDGKQVVKKVPPGYILIHRPTGMFFPPESHPGWNGVILDEDWELVDISSIASSVSSPSAPQQQSLQTSSQQQHKKQIQTSLKSNLETIQSALNLVSFLEDGEEVNIEELWESSVEFFEHSAINLKKVVEKTILEIERGVGSNKDRNVKKLLHLANELIDYLEETLKFFYLKGSTKKALSSGITIFSLVKQIINGNSIIKRFKEDLVPSKVEKSEKIFSGRFLYEIYDAIRQFEFSKRSLIMFNELLDLSTYFIKEKDLQKKQKYQLPIELLLSQIQKILKSRSGNFISVPIYEEFVEKGMFAFFVEYPEFLFRLIKKDLGIESNIKNSVHSGNGVFNYELDNGVYVVIEISKYFPGKENSFIPKSDYKYKGQQNYFLPILRIMNHDRISDEFSIRAKVYSSEGSEAKNLEKTFAYIPFSHGFESSFVMTHLLVFDVDKVDKIDEYKAFLEKTGRRAKKLSEIVESLDFKTLVKESVGSILYDVILKPTALGLSFLDFAFLKQLYPQIFEGEHSFSELDKLLKDLFGLKFLFPREEQILIDKEIVQVGPTSFYVSRRNLLSASLRYLSLIDYEYLRDKEGPIFEFTVKEKRPKELFDKSNDLAPEDIEDFKVLYRIAELSFVLSEKFFDSVLTEKDIIKALINSGIVVNSHKDLPFLYKISTKMLNALKEASSKNTAWVKYKGEAFEKMFLSILEAYLNDRYRGKEYSTSSLHRRLDLREIGYRALEIGNKRYLLYTQEEHGGIGDARMFIYDKSSNEVIPIIYELKAREKYIVPQLNSPRELYRSIHDVLLSFDSEASSYRIYKPYIYGIGIKSKQRGNYDIYFVDMNHGENLQSNVKKVKLDNKDAIIIYAPRVSITPFSLIGNSIVTSEETFD